MSRLPEMPGFGFLQAIERNMLDVDTPAPHWRKDLNLRGLEELSVIS